MGTSQVSSPPVIHQYRRVTRFTLCGICVAGREDAFGAACALSRPFDSFSRERVKIAGRVSDEDAIGHGGCCSSLEWSGPSENTTWRCCQFSFSVGNKEMR